MPEDLTPGGDKLLVGWDTAMKTAGTTPYNFSRCFKSGETVVIYQL